MHIWKLDMIIYFVLIFLSYLQKFISDFEEAVSNDFYLYL